MSSESVDVPINNGDTTNGATRRKVHTNSPPNDLIDESSPLFSNNTGKSKVKLRKQTQNIAARAAQRRANLHHKELMEDMGTKKILKISFLYFLIIKYRFSIFL